MEALSSHDRLAALKIIWDRDNESHRDLIEAHSFELLCEVELEGYEITDVFANARLAGDLDDAAFLAEKYEITALDVGKIDLSPVKDEEDLLVDKLAKAKQTRVLRWLVDFFQPKSAAELGKMGVLQAACRYGLFELVKSIVEQFGATRELAEATKPFLVAAERGDVELLKWLGEQGLDYGQPRGEAREIAVRSRRIAAARYICGSRKALGLMPGVQVFVVVAPPVQLPQKLEPQALGSVPVERPSRRHSGCRCWMAPCGADQPS
jgi:hypothetical protein